MDENDKLKLSVNPVMASANQIVFVAILSLFA